MLKFFSALISIILSIFIARFYGAEYSGIYFFVIGAVLFLSTLCTFGIQPIILKSVVVMKNNDLRLYFARINFMIFCAFIVIISFLLILLKLVDFNNVLISHYYPIILFAIPPNCFLLIFTNYFQAKHKFFLSIFSLTLGYQSVLIFICFLFSKNDANQLLINYNISIYIVFIVLLFFILRSKVPFITMDINLFFIKTIIFSAVPFFIAQMSGQLLAFSGQFILSCYVDSNYIAYYSVCMRVAIIMSFFVFAVNKVVAPKFAKFHSEGDYNNLKTTFNQANRLLWLISLPLLFLIVFYGENILSLFGDDFIKYKHVLTIIAAGQFIASVTGINIFLLQMTGHQKQIMVNMLISVCVAIPLGFVLVKNFNIVGAALMTFISLSTINLMSCITTYRKFGFSPLSFSNT